MSLLILPLNNHSATLYWMGSLDSDIAPVFSASCINSNNWGCSMISSRKIRQEKLWLWRGRCWMIQHSWSFQSFLTPTIRDRCMAFITHSLMSLLNFSTNVFFSSSCASCSLSYLPSWSLLSSGEYSWGTYRQRFSEARECWTWSRLHSWKRITT